MLLLGVWEVIRVTCMKLKYSFSKREVNDFHVNNLFHGDWYQTQIPKKKDTGVTA